MRVCPADAIEPKLLNIGDIEFGKAGDIDFVHGRLRIGHVRTPSLIKEVKKHIKQDSLAIIDVPPGTSCPVIAAMKNTDFVLMVTEPTPFGLHDLKLAVEAVKQLNIPCGLIINRTGIGNNFLYYRAIGGVEDKQHGSTIGAVGVVITVAEDHNPIKGFFKIGLHNNRSAI